jgi:hypothetical protein
VGSGGVVGPATVTKRAQIKLAHLVYILVNFEADQEMMEVKYDYSFDCFSCLDGQKIFKPSHRSYQPLFYLAYLLVNLSQLLRLFETSKANFDPQGNNYVILGL